MVAKLVDHLQMVGHLKCIGGWRIKSFEATPPAYGPGIEWGLNNVCNEAFAMLSEVKTENILF